MGAPTPTCIRKRHVWVPVGGTPENPGYVGIGGSAVSYSEQCHHCGLTRQKVFGDLNQTGNRNHGWTYIEQGDSHAE